VGDPGLGPGTSYERRSAVAASCLQSLKTPQPNSSGRSGPTRDDSTRRSDAPKTHPQATTVWFRRRASKHGSSSRTSPYQRSRSLRSSAGELRMPPSTGSLKAAEVIPADEQLRRSAGRLLGAAASDATIDALVGATALTAQDRRGTAAMRPAVPRACLPGKAQLSLPRSRCLCRLKAAPDRPGSHA
jgi:hypothetical protein